MEKRVFAAAASVFLAAVCLISALAPAVSALPGNSRTLRVGFFAFDGYNIQDGDGRRSGYGYDFLQQLARYGDWTYEYVGYDKSWSEMQDMTGSLAMYGTTTTNAAKLAVKQINDAGGVKIGDKAYTLALDAKDDQGDPTEALNAFNELTGDGVQLIVGSVTSACTSAITSAANSAGVCLITGCSTADSITTESDYIFRSCFKDSYQGSIAAYYAYKNNYKSVGVIYCAADTYSKGLYDAFTAACKEHSITVAAEASTDTMSLVMNVCQRIQVINFGQTIASGLPAEIASNPEVIKAYLGS